jgi:hypothetical protein
MVGWCDVLCEDVDWEGDDGVFRDLACDSAVRGSSARLRCAPA